MKPKICILTTGGTIAGAAARSDALTGYRAAETPLVEELHHTVERVGRISCPR